MRMASAATVEKLHFNVAAAVTLCTTNSNHSSVSSVATVRLEALALSWWLV
jgi:hypothetical protein